MSGETGEGKEEEKRMKRGQERGKIEKKKKKKKRKVKNLREGNGGGGEGGGVLRSSSSSYFEYVVSFIVVNVVTVWVVRFFVLLNVVFHLSFCNFTLYFVFLFLFYGQRNVIIEAIKKESFEFESRRERF